MYLLQVLRWVAGGGVGHRTWTPTVYGLEEGRVRTGYPKYVSMAVERKCLCGGDLGEGGDRAGAGHWGGRGGGEASLVCGGHG